MIPAALLSIVQPLLANGLGLVANAVLAKAFTYADPLAVLVAIKVVGIWALWWADMYVITGLLCAMYLFVVSNNLDVIESKK